MYIYVYIYICIYIYIHIYINIWEVLLYGRKLLDSDPASELRCVAEAYNQKKKEEEEKEAEEATSYIFFHLGKPNAIHTSIYSVYVILPANMAIH